MIWKLFKLQRVLDSLFDDRWFTLSLTLDDRHPGVHDADIQAHQA